MRNELADLLSQTFKLDDRRDGRRNEKARGTKKSEVNEKSSFSPKRYPSFFKIDMKLKNDESIPMVGLPLGGEKTIKFSTDVEDHYFDRTNDPGDLKIGLLDLASNETEGGDQPGTPREIATIMNVVKSSPHNGSISVKMSLTDDAQVGDVIKIQASLSSPERELDQIFLVKVAEPESKPKEPEKGDQPDTRLGLPRPDNRLQRRKSR